MQNPFPKAGSMIVRGTPIVIYQMGKVGSQTIRESLRPLDLPDSIHHIHYLSAKNLMRKTRYRSRNRLPVSKQLEQGKIIRKFLDTNSKPHMKVITVVREPVSQLLSSVFQNAQHLCRNSIRDDGTLDVQEIQNFIECEILNYDVAKAENCNWFDEDFGPALGIDVYQYEFDRAEGFAQIRQGAIDVLILRLENSDTWGSALSRFLQLYSPLEIIKQNASIDKDYRDAFKTVASNLRFPAAKLEEIYSSKYCRHFYATEMLQQCLQRWSSSDRAAA